MTYDVRWQKQWDLDRHRGIKRYRSTDKVKAHIKWLMEQGFNATSIAKAAGVDRGTVLNVLSGKNRMITLKIEKRIMAVTPDAIYGNTAGRGYVPAVGAVRRIQALMTMGWRYQDMNPMLGFNADKIMQNDQWISPENHKAIVGLYDRLWDKRGPARKASITRLLNRGWQKPMAWDDDTIDNPNAEPFGTVRGRRAA